MELVSKLRDGRISADNYLVELTIGEYVELAREIIHKNEFQRRRVRSSKTVYSLLRTDLMRGCVIPPIVLALTSELNEGYTDNADFGEFVTDNKEHLVILDGLQRTYTMMDLLDSLHEEADQTNLSRVAEFKIRAEFYVGLNRLAILYRMLTLNTGQTPMSLRQQIEILYLDFMDSQVGSIELIREIEGRYASRLNQYNFRDVVEGFNSYIERNELPIDRADLLENVRSLEKLSRENEDTDLFEGFLTALHAFITRMHDLCGDTEVPDQFREDLGAPFGKNVLQVFKKPQAMSGFGAALGRLKDFEIVMDLNYAASKLSDISVQDPSDFLEAINRSLDWIKQNATKIGNAQRSYFQYFFRDLINPETDSYLSAERAAESALRKYQSQNL